MFIITFSLLLDSNPLCACPLPQVTNLFQQHFDLSLLGVKDEPTLKVAFEILMEKKSEVLTSLEWTGAVFAYMCDLEGMGYVLNKEISQMAFIPLSGFTYCND
jgi:hypothetical protein